MATKQLTGQLFAGMILGGAENLKTNADIVNDLNVFPIPDGDTGDNMSRTIIGGAERLGADVPGELSRTARNCAEGMLLSARGNSGVILSQFFEGLAKGLENKSAVDARGLADAFKSGVSQAYSAVVKPAEGTVLTVMREATEYAAGKIDGDSTLESFFEAFTEEMYESLDRTPEKLPVLREAGVIDSGGAGFAYIIEGMSRVLRGETAAVPSSSGMPAPEKTQAADSFGPDSRMDFGYCTEVLLQLRSDRDGAESLSAEAVSEFLSGIGDSVVAFRTGTRVKLHVHTFEPDKVLAYCRRYGEFVSVKIENMSIQHSESTVVNRFVRQTPAKRKERSEFGVVAVAQGDGIKNLFEGFGADYIVDGQQTMNPSAEDFIRAFDAVNADKIIVFPNNSNIVLTAKQAGELYPGSEVYVVPSTTIAEGYAALTLLDLTSGDISVILEELRAAVESVVTGTVTWAVRDSVTNGIKVKKGDWLGFAGHELCSAEPTKSGAACALLGKIDMTDKDVIIAICGKDVTEEDRAPLREYIKANFAGTEFYEVDGGQDIYSFILAVE